MKIKRKELEKLYQRKRDTTIEISAEKFLANKRMFKNKLNVIRNVIWDRK